ncbi:hypothetical protein SISNIDRAFT_114037 [Sistotremastrum niveocremeum HHB9708]|uniref:Uncharacterized protein n=1 Tax=Sistotremastrum niveocremeum HHB9708 TaxID=1314777 RepID=A0A164TKT9_9AGAM|nr:hypothetical protein SISNIDRAFT_114037 [Sistotremastrum niveocremeum HHB9708]
MEYSGSSGPGDGRLVAEGGSWLKSPETIGRRKCPLFLVDRSLSPRRSVLLYSYIFLHFHRCNRRPRHCFHIWICLLFYCSPVRICEFALHLTVLFFRLLFPTQLAIISPVYCL